MKATLEEMLRKYDKQVVQIKERISEIQRRFDETDPLTESSFTRD